MKNKKETKHLLVWVAILHFFLYVIAWSVHFSTQDVVIKNLMSLTNEIQLLELNSSFLSDKIKNIECSTIKNVDNFSGEGLWTIEAN